MPFKKFGVYSIGSVDERSLNKGSREVETEGPVGRCEIQLKHGKIQLSKPGSGRKGLRQWAKCCLKTMILWVEGGKRTKDDCEDTNLWKLCR